MKQLLLRPNNGEMTMEEVPAPACLPGGVVVRNQFSIVSVGTERSVIEFDRQSLLAKARSRPDLVKRVVANAKREGVRAAYANAKRRLETLDPLGYSCAGEVIEVGGEVDDLKAGDLVACAGAGYASHAEFVYVPANLAVKIPVGVSPREAAFATLGAVAMQGIRRAELTPGESVAVVGLGLIGRITVQLLQAYGFPILGLDTNPSRVESALSQGMSSGAVIGRDDTDRLAGAFTQGRGLDAVIITASTLSSDPLELAGRISRERGRVSIVGDVGLNVPRRIYYANELDLRISRSYGPGRYDPSYEEHGLDYPVPYVRWTEKRNLEEFLRLAAAGSLRMDTLVTHTFNFDGALDAYKLVLAGTEEMLGVVLEYPQSVRALSRRIGVTARKAAVPVDHVGVGVIGAGDFAASTILPALGALDDVSIVGIASASGRSAVALAGKYGAAYATTDIAEILNDQAVSLVVIATRHGLHAEQAVAALEAGKHVYVEKPLATTMAGLAEVAEALRSAPGMLHVGFNRRFSPAAERIVQHFRARATPLLMQARINAGAIPASHWVHDPVEGGGRLIGEVCHFVDLLAMFAGSLPTAVSAVRLPPDAAVLGDDNAIVTLEFAGGSVGTILYSALGPGKMSKEYFELVGEGKSAVLDDFRSLSLYEGDGRVSTTGKQDKGQRAQFASLVRAVRAGGPPPISAEELLTTSLATLLIEKAMGTRASTPVSLSMLDSSSTADTAEGA